MPIVLTTATAREMGGALNFIKDQPEVYLDCGNYLSMSGHKILPCVSGVGVINAALMLGQILTLSELTGVINLGLAGAFDLSAMPLGSLCVVRQEIWPEYGLVSSIGIDPRGLSIAHGKIAGHIVWDRLDLYPRQAAQLLECSVSEFWPEVVSLTVSGVSGTVDRRDNLKRDFNADIENMEGFALAYGCAQAGVPFLEIRAVSNRVGIRPPEDWDIDLAIERLGMACAALFMSC